MADKIGGRWYDCTLCEGEMVTFGTPCAYEEDDTPEAAKERHSTQVGYLL